MLPTMVHLDLGAEPEDAGAAPPRGVRRALIAGLALLFTLAAFALAFLLGASYFQMRRYAAHGTRLQRMLAQSPQLDQVTEGLRDDGSPLVAAPRDEAELRALVARFRGQKLDEIVAKGRRWPVTRVYRATDMLYFIYFDAEGSMRDYVCISA
jgi:hypothetical protein